MANAHSFPLLRLPCLARGHILKIMDVREQYLFATLSKKSKLVTKHGVRELSYKFDLMLTSDYISIGFQKAGTKKWRVIKILPIHGDCFVSQSYIQLKVVNIMETAMEQLTFLNCVFKISNFKIDTCAIPNNFMKQFLAKVGELKIVIDELEIGDGEPDNEMFQWVMENCRDVRRLTNNCETTRDFRWDSQEPFTSEYLSLTSASWLTFGHLTGLFMNCRYFEIFLNQHQLTVGNLNQLVKMWMNDSRMELVKIGIWITLDLDRIMQDIEKEPIHEAYIKNNSLLFGAGRAYKIRQQCGKEAVVCIYRQDFMITSHFDNPHCDFWRVSDNEEEYDEEEEAGEDIEDEDDEEVEEDDF